MRLLWRRIDEIQEQFDERISITPSTGAHINDKEVLGRHGNGEQSKSQEK